MSIVSKPAYINCCSWDIEPGLSISCNLFNSIPPHIYPCYPNPILALKVHIQSSFLSAVFNIRTTSSIPVTRYSGHVHSLWAGSLHFCTLNFSSPYQNPRRTSLVRQSSWPDPILAWDWKLLGNSLAWTQRSSSLLFEIMPKAKQRSNRSSQLRDEIKSALKSGI